MQMISWRDSPTYGHFKKKRKKSLNMHIFCYKWEEGKECCVVGGAGALDSLGCVRAEVGEAGVVESPSCTLCRCGRLPTTLPPGPTWSLGPPLVSVCIRISFCCKHLDHLASLPSCQVQFGFSGKCICSFDSALLCSLEIRVHSVKGGSKDAFAFLKGQCCRSGQPLSQGSVCAAGTPPAAPRGCSSALQWLTLGVRQTQHGDMVHTRWGLGSFLSVHSLRVLQSLLRGISPFFASVFPSSEFQLLFVSLLCLVLCSGTCLLFTEWLFVNTCQMSLMSLRAVKKLIARAWVAGANCALPVHPCGLQGTQPW